MVRLWFERRFPPRCKSESNDRTLRSADRPLSPLAAGAARPEFSELRGDAPVVGARPRRLLAEHLGLFRPALADAAPRGAGGTEDAGRGVVSGRLRQLCPAGVPPRRSR